MADPENFLAKGLKWLFGIFIVVMTMVLLVQYIVWPFLKNFWHSVTGSGP